MLNSHIVLWAIVLTVIAGSFVQLNKLATDENFQIKKVMESSK